MKRFLLTTIGPLALAVAGTVTAHPDGDEGIAGLGYNGPALEGCEAGRQRLIGGETPVGETSWKPTSAWVLKCSPDSTRWPARSGSRFLRSCSRTETIEAVSVDLATIETMNICGSYLESASSIR